MARKAGLFVICIDYTSILQRLEKMMPVTGAVVLRRPEALEVPGFGRREPGTNVAWHRHSCLYPGSEPLTPEGLRS